MKRIILILVAICFSLSALAQSSSSESTPTDNTNDPHATYRLYPTTNAWTFLKLNTANGKITQVQFSVEGKDYMFETSLNIMPLAVGDKAKPGRFTLYPTKNVWTFLLLDQLEGTVYQVQWSHEAESRGVWKIE